MKNFNEILRDLREDKNLRQKDLADILAIDQRSISFYELGKYEPSLDTLKKIAIYFNVSTDYLLGLTMNPKPYERKK